MAKRMKKDDDAQPPAEGGRRRKANVPVGPASAPPAPQTPTTAAPAAAADVARTTAAQAAPTMEEIARRAYEIYLQRGGQHGQDMNDWLAAERELRARRGR